MRDEVRALVEAVERMLASTHVPKYAKRTAVMHAVRDAVEPARAALAQGEVVTEEDIARVLFETHWEHEGKGDEYRWGDWKDSSDGPQYRAMARAVLARLRGEGPAA